MSGDGPETLEKPTPGGTTQVIDVGEAGPVQAPPEPSPGAEKYLQSVPLEIVQDDPPPEPASRWDQAIPIDISGNTKGQLERPGAVPAPENPIKTKPSERSASEPFAPEDYAKSVAGLNEDQREQFNAILAVVGDDPVAQQQLKSMLVNDRDKLFLPDQEGHTAIENMTRIAASTNDKPGNLDVLTELIADINNPASIHQGLGGTCTAAALQGFTAESNPAEYSRIIAGLAVDGSVRLSDGTMLDTSERPEFDPALPATGQLFQPAIMKAQTDITHTQYDYGTNGGVWSQETTGKMMAALSGLPVRTVEANDANLDDIMKQIQSAAPGNPVMASIKVGAPGSEGNHEVQVIGVDPDGNVILRNPQKGTISTVPAAMFRNAVLAVSVPQYTQGPGGIN